MPKFGCDDGNLAIAASVPICSPPISPAAPRPRPAEAENGPSAPTMAKRDSENLTVELGQSTSDRLARLEAVLDGIATGLSQVQEQQGAMAATLNELRDLVVGQRTVKDWYSPEDVAEILGKQPYTVREWCRYRRINARKRPTGRGDAKEWEISREELERIKSHGLLPIPAKY